MSHSQIKKELQEQALLAAMEANLKAQAEAALSQKKAHAKKVAVAKPEDQNDDDTTTNPQAGRGAGGAKGAVGAQKARILALAGLSEADSVTRSQGATNKFSSEGAVLQNNVPLPPDAPTLTQASGQLFGSMNQDIHTVLASTTPLQTQPSTGPVSLLAGSAVGSAAAQQTSSATAAAQTTSTASTSGQSGVAQSSATTTTSTPTTTQVMGQAAQGLIDGDPMAAFLVLAVENKSSGKEVTGALQDLLTQGRNNQLLQQSQQNQLAAQKAEKAFKTQQILKKLGPIIDLIVTAICLAVTALTLGTTGPEMAMVAAMTIGGFVAGGAIGGAKNGDGFDLAGAATGAGIGSALASPIKQAITSLMKTLVKGIEEGVEHGVEQGLEKGASRAALEGAEKVGAKGLQQTVSAAEQEAAEAAEASAKNLVRAEKLEENARNASKGAMEKPIDLNEDDLAQAPKAAGSAGSKGASTLTQSLKPDFTKTKGFWRKLFDPFENKSVEDLEKLWNEAKTAEPRPNEKSTGEVFWRLLSAQKSKANQMGQIATTAMGIGNQLSMAVAGYVNTIQSTDAKQNEANAKQAKVIADCLQNGFDALNDSLSNITQNHSQVVNQAQQMITSHTQANNNAVANIAR